MAAKIFNELPRATDANGLPLSGAQWFFYASGTTTPQAVYANASLATSLGTSVTADSGGQFVPIYLDASVVYRGILKNAGGTTLRDIDPVNDVTGSFDFNGYVRSTVTTGSISPITGTSTVASLPAGSFTNSGTGSTVIGITSSITSGGNNTSSYHFSGITQSVAIWYLYGNGTTSYTSDERVKKNITTARDGYLEDLCDLRVVKYNWYTDDDDTPRELGLIAQEVEEVFPGLVQDAMHPTQDGEIRKVLKGSVLTFMLIKALQEANAKIDDLVARVEALEA